MGECTCQSSYRPVLPVLILLATINCTVRCSESPPPAGKVYPRGNQWAVGHLMGKKSVGSLPGWHDSSQDSDYPTPLEREDKLLDRYERPSPSKLLRAFVGALVHHQSQSQMSSTADRQLLRRAWRDEDRSTADRQLLGRAWRDEDRGKYIREMSDLILPPVNLQDNGSN